MNFLLKIVEGPNKGAEIALVSGVAVTLGKGDDCDIMLADSTLPPAPVNIEAAEDGVTIDGEALEPFLVKTLGATSFAVGPADAQWGELKWPQKVESTEVEGPKVESREPEVDKHEPEGEKQEKSPEDGGKRKRGGCFGCLVVLVLLILAIAGLAWFYRAAIMDFCKSKGYDISSLYASLGRSEEPSPVEKITLASIAARYGLSVEENDGSVKLVGDLKTRAERLRATAEAYEARPGVELDLSDDESFRVAAEDALFTLTEGAIKVVSATNRVLSVSGISRSPEMLRRTLMALNADLPRLRDIDVAGVSFGVVPKREASEELSLEEPSDGMSQVSRSVSKKSALPSLPVCGILTKPYPCLVLRDGTRVLEGAPLGGNVILKIEADAVTVTNSMGRFTWKP